jgi:hypothetical protein
MFVNFKKTSLFLFFTAIVATAGFWVLQSNEIFTSSAESDDNFSGYAWSDNFGWISFNCTNESNCGDSDYGVDLDMEYGDFSGYAWSENIGWIDFNPSGPYPGAPAHGAKYEYEDTGDERRVTGWAKALVLGDKGWIKMHPDPWLEGWSKRRQITLDHDKIDSSLDHFPIPIFINGSAGLDGDDVTSVFDEVGSNNQKIAVTGPDGVDELYVEIESWDATAEEAVLWVSKDDLTVSASEPTYLYLYYDNSQSDNTEYVDTATTATSSEQIWGNDYAMVQHLNEESGDAVDSTANNNDGNLNGGVTQGVAGQVDGAFDFDGSDDYVAIQNLHYDTAGEIERLTVSAWVKIPVDGGNWSIVDFDRSEYYTCAAGIPNSSYSGEGDYVGFHTSGNGGGDMWSNSTIRDGEWHFITWSFDKDAANDKKIYIDGELDAAVDQHSGGIGSGSTRYGFIGDGSEASGFDGGRNGRYYEGMADEISISTTTRSDAWVKASYEAGRDNLLTWSREEVDNYGVTADINTGEFSGWAWNKNKGENYSGIGWISFNCDDSGAGGCTDTDYNVQAHLNTVPDPTDMTAPNWSHANACSAGAKRAFLSWDVADPDKGAAQEAYQLVVDDDENRTDDTPLLETGRIEGTSKQYELSSSFLDYGESYSWWLQAWDNHDISSPWNQYDTEPDTQNNDGNVYTFTVYEHEFPDPEFYHIPQSISAGEDVEFTSTSTRYTAGDPTNPTNCTDSTCFYDWTIPDSAIVKDGDPDASSTIILEFTEESNYTVGLQVSDTEGYGCGTSTTIKVKQPLPEWREIKVD